MSQILALDLEGSYLGWLLAAKLAEWNGIDVRVINEGVFIRFIIPLPSGEVTINIPVECVEGNWKKFEGELVPSVSAENIFQRVQDCLNGRLVLRHVLIIPEKKEETE